MDLATAAAYLRLSPRSALRLLAREDVQPLRLGLRLRRWRRSDLDELVAGLPRRDAGTDDAEAALQRVALRLPGPGAPPRV